MQAWQDDKMCLPGSLRLQRPSLKYQVPGLLWGQTEHLPWGLPGYNNSKILSGIAAVIWAKIKVPLVAPTEYQHTHTPIHTLHFPNRSFSIIQMNVEWISGENSCFVEESNQNLGAKFWCFFLRKKITSKNWIESWSYLLYQLAFCNSCLITVIF